MRLRQKAKLKKRLRPLKKQSMKLKPLVEPAEAEDEAFDSRTLTKEGIDNIAAEKGINKAVEILQRMQGSKTEKPRQRLYRFRNHRPRSIKS